MFVEHERLSLLLTYSGQRVAQPTVTAHRDILIEQRAYELDALLELLLLAELVANLDLEAVGLRDRLDGLDAPVVRARQDARQRILGERSDQIDRLPPAAFVERTTAIVRRPFRAIASTCRSSCSAR